MVYKERNIMKILVTGGSGFIGSHLVERLVRKGFEVRVFVKKEDMKKRGESFRLLESLDVEIYYGDLLNKASLEKAVKNIDVIFHLAAIARPMAIPNEAYFRVNEDGTRNLLEVCNNIKKIKKIVITSSVSAVGPSRDGNPVSEKAKCRPIDVYGWSKLAQENVSFHFIKNYNLPIVFLRPPMVFGPRDFEILKLFKAVNRGFFPVSSNNKCLDMIYVDNLVDACLLVMEKGKVGEVYHIADDHYSINEIVGSIAKAENKKLMKLLFPKFFFVFSGYIIEFLGKLFNFHPPFKHDTVKWMTERFWYIDTSKIRKLGYKNKIGLDKGIKKTVDYYKEKGLL